MFDAMDDNNDPSTLPGPVVDKTQGGWLNSDNELELVIDSSDFVDVFVNAAKGKDRSKDVVEVRFTAPGWCKDKDGEFPVVLYMSRSSLRELIREVADYCV
jgi:hypothetical protein